MTDNLYVWSNIIKKNIEDQKEEIFKRDYKFFKIDRLERIAERIDTYSADCEICESFKKEVEDLSKTASQHINGSPRDRSRFEKRNEIIVKHLKEEHGLVHRDYYASVYAFAGLASGLIVFGAITFFIDLRYFIFSMLIGFTLGLMIGRVIGRKKDKQKETEGLIL